MKKLYLIAIVAALLVGWAAHVRAAPLSGTLSYQYNNYSHISTLATTVVKNKPGLVSAVCINTKGATGNVLTIYDNASAASGTVIAVIDTTSAVGCQVLNVATVNGIVVLTATGTAADVTVAWR